MFTPKANTTLSSTPIPPAEFPARAHLNAPAPETGKAAASKKRKADDVSQVEWEELGDSVSSGLRRTQEFTALLGDLSLHYLLYKRMKRQVLDIAAPSSVRQALAAAYLQETAPLLSEELFPKKGKEEKKEGPTKKKLSDGKKKAVKDLKELFELAWEPGLEEGISPEDFTKGVEKVRSLWEDGKEKESEKELENLRKEVDKLKEARKGKVVEMKKVL